MRIRCTAITDADVGNRLGKAAYELQEYLAPYFVDDCFGEGVDIFMFVVISVDSDPVENEKGSNRYNRYSRIKNLKTGMTERCLGRVLLLGLSKVLLMNEKELQNSITTGLIQRLKDPDVKIPKKFKFDYASFSEKLCSLLVNF